MSKKPETKEDPPEKKPSGRNPKMDEFMRKIHASPRFTFEGACEAIRKAFGK